MSVSLMVPEAFQQVLQSFVTANLLVNSHELLVGFVLRPRRYGVWQRLRKAYPWLWRLPHQVPCFRSQHYVVGMMHAIGGRRRKVKCHGDYFIDPSDEVIEVTHRPAPSFVMRYLPIDFFLWSRDISVVRFSGIMQEGVQFIWCRN